MVLVQQAGAQHSQSPAAAWGGAAMPNPNPVMSGRRHKSQPEMASRSGYRKISENKHDSRPGLDAEPQSAGLRFRPFRAGVELHVGGFSSLASQPMASDVSGSRSTTVF